ncbi:MAG: MOSC domain-containing protein [Anaerolineaceae bacterium]|nr:MOSC domain-containing protein [Anaerolineaceae bacterium]
MSIEKIKLVGVQLATPITYVEEDQSTWTSSLVKKPVCHDVYLRTSHLAGNEQADLNHHGGKDKTLFAFPLEHICFWRDEVSLPDLPFGGLGENLTVMGVSEMDICIGDRFQLGEAFVEVSQPRLPCWKIGRCWGVHDLGKRMEEAGHSGWYFRTISEGSFSLADDLILTQRSQPDWTIAEVFRIITHPLANTERAKALLEVPEAAESMKTSLAKVLESGIYPDQTPRLFGRFT